MRFRILRSGDSPSKHLVCKYAEFSLVSAVSPIVRHPSYVLRTEVHVKSLSSIPIGARFRWNSQSPVTEKQPWHGTLFFDDGEKRRFANRVLKLHEQDPNLYAGDNIFVKGACVERLMVDAVKQNLEITAARRERQILRRKASKIAKIELESESFDSETDSDSDSNTQRKGAADRRAVKRAEAYKIRLKKKKPTRC